MKMFRSLLVLFALFSAAPYAAIADSSPEKAGTKLEMASQMRSVVF